MEDYGDIEGIKYVNATEENDAGTRICLNETIWLNVEEFKCTFHEKSAYHSADGINGGTLKWNGVWNITEDGNLQMALHYMSYEDIDPSLMVEDVIVTKEGGKCIKEFTLNQLMEFESEIF